MGDFEGAFLRHPIQRRRDAFALDAFMEVPTQYHMCQALQYVSQYWELPETFKAPHAPFGPPDDPNFTDPNYGVLVGWTAVYDRNKQAHFYWNEETGDSFWDKPVAIKAVSRSPSKKHAFAEERRKKRERHPHFH